MISRGRKSENFYEKVKQLNLPEASIATHYFAIKKFPYRCSSPLREDRHPSFSFYLFPEGNVIYKDFATGDTGSIYRLLEQLWHCNREEMFKRIWEDFSFMNPITKMDIMQKNFLGRSRAKSKLMVKVRQWRQYDIDYWKSFGISIPWLIWANVHPISHIFLNGEVYKCDKLAYAFAEFKEDKTTFKVYQPLNTKGFKWQSSHNKSVVSLWTQAISVEGDKVCICSSLKDALCLWANMGIPSIAPQGEAYRFSKTALKVLQKTFKHIYICFDNDAPGLKDAETLSEETGFINIILPSFEGGKDISDLYKAKGREEFIKILSNLFNSQQY